MLRRRHIVAAKHKLLSTLELDKVSQEQGHVSTGICQVIVGKFP